MLLYISFSNAFMPPLWTRKWHRALLSLAFHWLDTCYECFAEIVLPGTNTTTEAGTVEPKKIPAGQQVLVIRTPKGVYIRTPDGKIFAVRSKPQANSSSPLDTLANTGSNISTGGVTIVRPTMTTTVSAQAIGKTPTGVTVIRPNIRPSIVSTTSELLTLLHD